VEGVTLELALDADGQRCITVSDQGVGFEQEGLDHRSDAGQVGWGLFSIRDQATSITTPIGATSIRDKRRASPDALRILIVDDHAAGRSALRDTLNQQPQLSVVGDALLAVHALRGVGHSATHHAATSQSLENPLR
jgi:hypothetical protein